MSESLLDLAGRVKKVEDSAAAVQEKNREKLRARRDELEAAIEQEKIELEAAATLVKEDARSWWSETKNSIEHQINQMRADFEKWQGDMKEKSAERAAENAEDDAVVAVNLAAYCLDAAEWAVVRAELARGEADQLAARS
ncbi:hypothetical protein [Mycobacterium scrofulaceum]|uniref:hypothetical protein n=1 Tax=Mycobacterium scrofulaceum TaxID=1783 RepID=UPI001E578501|nr:hypothetical protein [Mycobacterium scrofulaceum]